MCASEVGRGICSDELMDIQECMDLLDDDETKEIKVRYYYSCGLYDNRCAYVGWSRNVAPTSRGGSCR